MSTPWHQARLCAFDLETTGPDPQDARIVQYAIAHLGGGAPPETEERIVDAGVDIPEEAAKIHGVTTERAAFEGRPAEEAVTAIAASLSAALGDGVPLVGHNIVYDLTVLDRECWRYLGEGLEDVLGREALPVVDTLVLSKQVDPYRRRVSEAQAQGAHTLKSCVQVFLPPQWGIGWEDAAAHGALYDAQMSARVAVAIAQRHPEIGSMGLRDLHVAQKRWRAEQAESLQAWLRTNRDPEAVVDGAWPLIPKGCAW